MKLLLTSDLHQRIGKWQELVDAVKSERSRFVLIAGDLLPKLTNVNGQKKFFGQMRRDFPAMQKAGPVTVLTCFGNDAVVSSAALGLYPQGRAVPDAPEYPDVHFLDSLDHLRQSFVGAGNDRGFRTDLTPTRALHELTKQLGINGVQGLIADAEVSSRGLGAQVCKERQG